MKRRSDAHLAAIAFALTLWSCETPEEARSETPEEACFVDRNSLIPRVELGGRTPDEAYRGDALGLSERLRLEHTDARVRRIAENALGGAGACEPAPHAPPSPRLRLVP